MDLLNLKGKLRDLKRKARSSSSLEQGKSIMERRDVRIFERSLAEGA